MGEEKERKGETTTKKKNNFIYNCKSLLPEEPFGDLGFL
jgi:hypothetical protein